MKRKVMAMVAMVLLAGCQQQPLQAAMPQSPDQALFAAQVALDGLIKQADLYAKLPRCGTPGATQLCSTSNIAGNAYNIAIKAQSSITAARVLTTAYAQIKSPGASDLAKVNAAVDAATAALTQAENLIQSLQTK